MMPFTSKQCGMTLIELSVTMAVTFIVAGALFATYRAQQMSHTTQRALVEMNQNIRSANYYLNRDGRKAGCDYSVNPNGPRAYSFRIANQAEMQFEVDWGRDGGVPAGADIVRYALTNDANRDGIADGFPCHLGREEGNGGLQIIAENIEAIDFEYFGYSPNPPFQPIPLNVGAAAVTAANMDNIRFVRVTIVARYADAPPPMSFVHSDTQAYWNDTGTRQVLAAQNDNIRRMALTTEIQMRNM